MKVLQINVTSGEGSTGKICEGISFVAKHNDIDNLIIYSSGYSKNSCSRKVGSYLYMKLQALKSRVLGNYGFNSHFATYKLISEIKKFAPDIVHLHNLHGHNVNLAMLFGFLKKNNIKIIWTFHDCWAFTAYCSHFAMVGCNKWQFGCYKCPQVKSSSWFFDRSKTLYRRKKKLFSSLDLTIVTPSEWLAGLVKQSFLKEYPVKVIHNGIDLNIFKPTESNFREKYNIGDKFIVLGVAFGWGVRKGLDVFIELSKRLDDERYKIVLVGTDDTVDTQLPKNIISIHRTQNQTELAEIYTAANVFVNPTREEVLGLVNIEANACGTPVVVFDTGGAPECIDNNSGAVVSHNDVESVIRVVDRIRESIPFSKNDCINRAKQFDMNDKFKEYVELYKILNGK